MTRIAYLDPVGGLAGDMVLAALLDAGAPRDVLDGTVRALGLDDVRIVVTRTERSGMATSHVDVRTPAGSGRRAGEMRRKIAGAPLPERVRSGSLRAFDRLVAAEADVHGVDPSEVVLHELGDDDTLVDICGAFALFDALVGNEERDTHARELIIHVVPPTSMQHDARYPSTRARKTDASEIAHVSLHIDAGTTYVWHSYCGSSP